MASKEFPAGKPRRAPSHPGSLLNDILGSVDKSKSEIAELLGISRQHLHEIVAERKGVSPEVAVRLGKLFGNGPDLWVRMQGLYDTWHAERQLASEIKKIPTLKAVA